MIQIENVELSKSTVQENEVLIIKITVREVMGTWEDINQFKWEDLINKTWDAIKRKIF